MCSSYEFRAKNTQKATFFSYSSSSGVLGTNANTDCLEPITRINDRNSCLTAGKVRRIELKTVLPNFRSITYYSPLNESLF
jgi:hypothetical protein